MTAKLMTFLACVALACGPQEFQDITQAPFVIDVNEIAVDPASGQRLCLGWAVVEVGSTFSRTAMYCDPDGDPLVFTPQPYLTVDEPNGTYTLRLTPSEAGVTYWDVSVCDVVEPPRTARTRTGTFVLAAVPRNRPPMLGCAAVE